MKVFICSLFGALLAFGSANGDVILSTDYSDGTDIKLSINGASTVPGVAVSSVISGVVTFSGVTLADNDLILVFRDSAANRGGVLFRIDDSTDIDLGAIPDAQLTQGALRILDVGTAPSAITTTDLLTAVGSFTTAPYVFLSPGSLFIEPGIDLVVLSNQSFEVATDIAVHSGTTKILSGGAITIMGPFLVTDWDEISILADSVFTMNSPAGILRLTTGSTIGLDPTATLTLKGVAGQQLQILSSTAGVQSFLTSPSGSLVDIEYAAIMDVDASGGDTIVAVNSINLGNNANINFQNCPPPDSDSDCVPDSEDNCPSTPNPLQENNDGDAAGDACDPDDDNDGVGDVYDRAPLDDSNAECTSNNGTNATLVSAQVMDDQTCASKESVDVNGDNGALDTVVFGPNGDLRLISEKVIFTDTKVEVGGRLEVINADPCPGCVPVDQLVFTQAPSSLVAGANPSISDNIVVQRQDQFGNPISSGELLVTVDTSSILGRFDEWHDGPFTHYHLELAMADGEDSRQFYYKDAGIGTSIITSSSALPVNGTQDIEIVP